MNASLNAVLGATLDPSFTQTFDKAEAQVVNFNKLSAAASQLKPFSNATASALQAAKSIGQLNDVLAQLKIEQAAATVPAELNAYNTAIKAVTGEMQALKSQGSSAFGSIGKALTEGLSSVRQLAYILPGVGIAGIFNLAFDAISKSVTEMGLFGGATKEVSKDAEEAQTALDGLEESTAKDLLKFRELTAIVTDSNNPYSVRLNALKELRKEYQPFLKNLSDEQILNGQIADAVQAINAALIEKLKLEAGEDKIVKLLKERLDVQLKLEDLENKQLTTSGFAASLKDATGNAAALGVQLQASVSKSIPDVDKLKNRMQELDLTVNQILSDLKQPLEAKGLLDYGYVAAVKAKDATKEYEKAFNSLIRSINSEKKEFGKDIIPGAPYIPVQIKPVITDISEFDAQVQKLTLEATGALFKGNQGIKVSANLLNADEIKKNFKEIKPLIDELVNDLGVNYPKALDKFSKSGVKNLEDYLNYIIDLNKAIDSGVKQIISDVTIGLAEGLGKAISGAKNPFEALANLLGGTLEAIGEKLILLSPLIAAVKVAINSLNPVLALAAGFGLVAIGAAISNLPKIQAHADGGIFTKPTQIGSHLFGEAGPEALIPLDKLAGMMGGGNSSNVQFIIRGGDLVGVLNRGNLRQNRNYGSNFNTTG